MTFAQMVARELNGAREAHDPINSAHEGYAVILEELYEFWDECRAKRAARSPERMLRELVQTAAMAQRTAEDLGLLRPDQVLGANQDAGGIPVWHVRTADGPWLMGRLVVEGPDVAIVVPWADEDQAATWAEELREGGQIRGRRA